MERKIKIAIATPGMHNPMGTFSRNYVEFLPFDNFRLFGGSVPFFREDTSRNQQKLLRYFFSLISLKNQKKMDQLKKNRFKKILQEENVNCVLAEFLNTGAAIREACEELNIPIVSNVLGYEIHKKDMVEKNRKNYEDLAKYKSILVPVAKNMIPKLKDLGFADNRIIYSPLGARDEFFDISPDYNAQTFLAVGRFTESKSPQSTIKAFGKVLLKFPKAQLIMAGAGELLEESKSLAEELKVQDSINFIGWISPSQQMELLKKSSIFVQHSVTSANGDAEGTPVAILEASAAGLPIVSTIHGGIIDTVLDNKTGFLVPENDWEMMAEKMTDLLENPNKLKTFGENGKTFIRNNFSMRKHIEHVKNAIELALKL